MKTTFATPQAAIRSSKSASGISAFFAGIPNPLTLLLAYQDYIKFRALDAECLRDIGLTQADVDNTTFADFVRQPRR